MYQQVQNIEYERFGSNEMIGEPGAYLRRLAMEAEQGAETARKYRLEE